MLRASPGWKTLQKMAAVGPSKRDFLFGWGLQCWIDYTEVRQDMEGIIWICLGLIVALTSIGNHREELALKKRVLVVYGGGHWITLSQALEKRLGKPTITGFVD